jgi:3',5'-cyclic AMP phosphodiesterase CpdA
MFVSRRLFIGGLLSSAAFGGCRGFFNAGGEKMSFGVITDVHIAIDKNKKGKVIFHGSKMFRKALEYYRDAGVDAIAICGDIADDGFIEELEETARIWFEVFPDNKAPDGRTVEKLFVAGNHDYIGWKYGRAKKIAPRIWGSGESPADHRLATDFGKNWSRIFKEPYSDVWMKTIKGYNFVGAHWCRNKGRKGCEMFNYKVAEFLKAKAPTFDAGKPFFYFQHPHLKNTCYGPRVWGQDSGVTRRVLDKFPNAVAFSGHSHTSIDYDKSIWQDTFTSIGAGSLKYIAGTYADCRPYGRENDISLLESNNAEINAKKVMKRIVRPNSHQGLLVRIDSEYVTCERIDFEDLKKINNDWDIPADCNKKPYEFAKREKTLLPPEFSKGDKISVRKTTGVNRGGAAGVPSVKQDVWELSIPSAEGAETRVFDYAVVITDETGKSEERCVLAAHHFRSRTFAKDKVTLFRVALSQVPSKGRVKFEVYPRNSYLTRGKALCAYYPKA